IREFSSIHRPTPCPTRPRSACPLAHFLPVWWRSQPGSSSKDSGSRRFRSEYGNSVQSIDQRRVQRDLGRPAHWHISCPCGGVLSPVPVLRTPVAGASDLNTGIQFNPSTNAVSNATSVGLPTGTFPARVVAFSARFQF